MKKPGNAHPSLHIVRKADYTIKRTTLIWLEKLLGRLPKFTEL